MIDTRPVHLVYALASQQKNHEDFLRAQKLPMDESLIHLA